ncbi:MAG TPA: hypothetical protein VME43_17305 [Bryobacteraceae bacterium]|nr:hypothetical protein [Bryobacteraceae bacterium]
MQLQHRRPIPIWFFIGVLLIVYGFLILGQGMWWLFAPPVHQTVLAELRPNLWWGALLLVVGGGMAGSSAPW